MLTKIELCDFKCFDNLKLPLANLTLLSGANASGKSSVLQALVLLNQTMRDHEWSRRLLLNGDTIKLGMVGDIVDKVNGRRTIGIGLTDDEQRYHWEFSGERSEMSMGVDSVVFNGRRIEEFSMLQYLLPPQVNNDPVNVVKMAGSPDTQSRLSLSFRLRGLTYITAERIGPREFYTIEETAIVVGASGEHAISILHLGRDENVIEGLVLEGVPKTRLHQVQARMRQFFPGCGLAVQPVPQANAVTLGLRTSDDTDFHRPIHIGFGLTQILPIVVAALSANQGDIILIENPEVHLHPAGQALMGQFLADVARTGIQVIVETHSDHILNGIRRSVKAGNLSPSGVAIHFFRPRTSRVEKSPTLNAERPLACESAQVISPILDATGNIDLWPEGFFDQFDKDLNYFAGWGD
jgi:predicted ATPase